MQTPKRTRPGRRGRRSAARHHRGGSAMTDTKPRTVTTGHDYLTGLDEDDLQSLRRQLTADWLKARESHEDAGGVMTLLAYESWSEIMVRILVATGDYPDGLAAQEALNKLTFPQAAERYVELWADREGLLWDLDNSAICEVADMVRDWVAERTGLNQIPMRSLVEPYLPGGTR